MDCSYIKVLLLDGRKRRTKAFAQGPKVSGANVQLREFVKDFRIKPIFIMEFCQHSLSVGYMIHLELLGRQLATEKVMKSAQASLHSASQDEERVLAQPHPPIEIR